MAIETEKPFLRRGRQIGSVFVLPAQAAIEMTEYCRLHAIEVFGAEGFRLIGDRIQPQQEHSCDFGEETADRHDQLVEFLSRRLDVDLWFEVVADDVF